MGISGFHVFFESIAKTRHISELKGTIVLLDLMLKLYQKIIGMKKNNIYYTDSNGNDNNHIHAIIAFIISALEKGITLCPVLDSSSPTVKEATIKKRKAQRDKAKILCGSISDKSTAEYKKNEKKSTTIGKTEIDDCIKLLTLMGIPFIKAKKEADPQCAILSKTDNCSISGIFTDDSDVIAFGANKMYKNINFKDNTMTEISIDDVLKYMQTQSDLITSEVGIPRNIITFDIFLDFATILGVDYCNGIKGVNRQLLFKEFITHRCNICELLDSLHDTNDALKEAGKPNKFIIPEDFLMKSQMAKQYYYNPDIYDPKSVQITVESPNVEDLRNYLIKTQKIDEKTTNLLINKLIDNYKIFSKASWLDQDSDNLHCKISQAKTYKSFKSYQYNYYKKKYNALYGKSIYTNEKSNIFRNQTHLIY